MSKLVSIETFLEPSEAMIASSYLNAYDVAAFTPDQHISFAAWHWTHALGGARLLVFEEDSEKAQALLADKQKTDNTDAGTKTSLGILHPYVSWSDLFTAVGALVCIGIPLPIWKCHPDYKQDDLN